MEMIGNVSDWLSYAGGALIKVADSAGSTVGQLPPKGLTTINVVKYTDCTLRHFLRCLSSI